MASVMGIYEGLVGPKSEHVEQTFVLLLFLERSRGPRGCQDLEQRSGNGPFRGRRREIFHYKGFVSIFRIVFLT